MTELLAAKRPGGDVLAGLRRFRRATSSVRRHPGRQSSSRLGNGGGGRGSAPVQSYFELQEGDGG